MLPGLCLAVILIYEPHGATYGQRCPTMTPTNQSVHVRTTSEIKTDTARIDAMKAAGLGVPVVSCVKRKKWGLESVGWRWHMWEKCK